MQQPQFGRRGASLNGQAVEPAAQIQPRHQPSYIDHDGSFTGWRWVVVTLIVTVILLAWIEALISGTSLITPINETVLWTMRGLGAVVGLGVGLLLFAKIASEKSIVHAALTVLVMPLMFGFLFDGIAWRVADWAAFGFSDQKFVPAQYPVKWVSHGRKGRRDVVEIDPFGTGENADIPIPDAQYEEVFSDYQGKCVTVLQRKNSSGVIEILTNGQYTLHEPEPAEIVPCDGSSPSSVSASNPWGKK